MLPVINAKTLAAAQWSTGQVLKSFDSFTNCGAINLTRGMVDMQMNFVNPPEIFTISDTFDYYNYTESAMIDNLVSGDTS